MVVGQVRAQGPIVSVDPGGGSLFRSQDVFSLGEVLVGLAKGIFEVVVVGLGGRSQVQHGQHGDGGRRQQEVEAEVIR